MFPLQSILFFEGLLMHSFLQSALACSLVAHLENKKKTQSHLPSSFSECKQNPNPSTVSLMIEYQGK